MRQAILMKKGKNEQEMLHGDIQPSAAAITIAAKVQLILTNMGSCCSSSS